MKNIVNLEYVNLMASKALKSSLEWFISNNHKLGMLIVTGKFPVWGMNICLWLDSSFSGCGVKSCRLQRMLEDHFLLLFNVKKKLQQLHQTRKLLAYIQNVENKTLLEKNEHHWYKNINCILAVWKVSIVFVLWRRVSVAMDNKCCPICCQVCIHLEYIES